MVRFFRYPGSRLGKTPNMQVKAFCYAIRTLCESHGLNNDALIAIDLIYWVLREKGFWKVFDNLSSGEFQSCTQAVLAEDRLDANSEISEAKCLSVYAAALAAAYYVFERKEVHGTSGEDIGNNAVLQYLKIHSKVTSPKAWGRTFGYRRAIEVLFRKKPKALAMSVVAGDEPWDTFIPAKNDPSESQFILNDFLEFACGGKNSIDRKIVDMKLDGNTYQTIAEVLNMKLSTVRARFNRVLEKAEALNN